MKIDIKDYKGSPIITPTGDIDLYSSPELRAELMRLISKKTRALHVDFGNVSYIDSSGIATFVEGLKNMKSYGGRLKLIGLSEAIMEIFRFSKLDKVFEIYGNIDEAFNS
ncbi:MAG TPA: anti-sigma factor antagonist [Nitrospirae bacterium]|nr:anti-sigma-B factor antagonist [bacterium BMS3Abin10]GBE38272.1 anti-sigma-B factor antagonist [bacterium BMS3Bbin08]HDH50890.1 anti-sigma factor antagonist [Nitrospirota bacterium]HDK16613.1 anti-sigma factor antagonist [Nitrospirota bacterium]HDK41542.1 anti-sigma factor antagonist [Nitrospirota bacterium]